ncbi:hypothetical protein EYZ11_005185 [Aspergillus tanneri]|uniref:Uncharacterized protein n=1 Tax=Aspergillus tanneri TaxID=1220188 RepID=A0A4S3JJ77_9EURO|nr:hypothetical protein EYZ11_005185 [Aspergillus tanneri]
MAPAYSEDIQQLNYAMSATCPEVQLY